MEMVMRPQLHPGHGTPLYIILNERGAWLLLLLGPSLISEEPLPQTPQEGLVGKLGSTPINMGLSLPPSPPQKNWTFLPPTGLKGT